MSEMNDENLITLTDEDGNDVPFLLLDIVTYRDDDYMVLLPMEVEEMDEDEADEVVVLKVVRTEDEETYEAVEDGDILTAVFDLFQEQDEDEDEE